MATIDSSMELTGAEKRCYLVVKQLLKGNLPPSVEEVGKEMGVTRKRASVLLRSLARKGKVKRRGRIPRSLELIT